MSTFFHNTARYIAKSLVVIGFFTAFLLGGHAYAATGDNTSGFAWSANVGWISFNCTSQPDGCDASPGGLDGGLGGGGGAGTGGGTGTGGAGGAGGFIYTPHQGNVPTVSFLDKPRLNIFSALNRTIHSAFSNGIFNISTAYADGEITDLTSSSYGVSVDPTTGNFSGYAWSPYVGWISFNEYTGCPDGTCTPRLDLDTGKISGWAKVVAASGTSGWDGWISLSCHNTSFWCTGFLGAAPEYGLTHDTATKIVSGYAWGDDVMGWINFNGPTYHVEIDLNQPTVTLGTDATAFCPAETVTLTWNATGMTSCTASATNADPAFTGVVPTSGTAVVTPSAPGTTYTISCFAPGSDTAYQSSVTLNLDPLCSNELILSAEPAPAQCTAGYRTNFTVYSPTATTYTSCTPLTPLPLGAPTVFASVPNAGNSYLVSIPDVLVASNPTNFSVSCTQVDGTVDTATTSVARACAAPACDFTSATLTGEPLKASLTWTSSGGTGTGLTASGGWSGTKAFSGSQSGIAFTSPETTYTLTVTNPDGATDTCSATLNTEDGVCDPDPNDPNGADCDVVAEVTLTADPTSLGEGGGSTILEWTTSNIETDSCVGYSWPTTFAWNGAKADEGMETVSITTSTTFRVQCTDAYDGSFVSDDVTVTVDGTPVPDPECTDPVECPTVRTKPWYIER